MNCLHIVLALAISCMPTESAVCEEESSSGRTFMLAVMDNRNNNAFVAAIKVNIAADRAGHVNVTAPSISLTRTYQLKDGVTTVMLNRSIITTVNGTSRTGVLLETDVDVSVRVVIDSRYDVEQEGYLALPVPVHHAPASYVISSWEPVYPSEFLIASAADNTTVIITDFTRQQISSQSITLNKFDTYQKKYTVDPSGIFVYATGPVSVLSGSQCSEVLFIGCQALLEQLVPVSSWGKSYITPALQSKHWNVVRVYTANDTVTITLTNSSSTRTLYVSSFNYTTIVYQDEPLSIQSDQPVQVMQYSTGNSDGSVGDPFMISIPDVGSFLSQYKLKPLTIYKYDVNPHVYLTITIDHAHETGLLLDGQSIGNITKHDVVVTSHGNYSVITVRLTAEVECILRHQTSGVTFGALLYGYHHDYVAYGYGLGMKLRREGCTIPVPTSTTPVTTTRQPTTTSTSTMATLQPGQRLTCMACQDMIHVELCDIVKHCNDMEVCFLEQYFIRDGITRFRSGCGKPSECPLKTSDDGAQLVDGCKSCCSENYCNNKGCGEHGLPAIGTRGPMCYSCGYVSSVDECTTVELCHPEQVCRVSKFEWGGQIIDYRLGCASKQLCKTSSTHMTRSAPVCNDCCDSDFCNTSCNNTGHPGVSLVG